jgi:aspartate-semialdehyde dehydrogenase
MAAFGHESNCSAIGLVLALAPLHRRFQIESVMAVTMQAVSGAGIGSHRSTF